MIPGKTTLNLSWVSTALLLAFFLMLSTFMIDRSQASQDNPSLDRIRSKAATQHEIVVILIDKKEFAKAAAEAVKIFEMKWPADQEPTLLKELLFFADRFLHKGQAALGIELIEKSIKFFKTPASLIEIWKEKGFLYKETGQNDKALECFREAQQLEKNAP